MDNFLQLYGTGQTWCWWARKRCAQKITPALFLAPMARAQLLLQCLLAALISISTRTFLQTLLPHLSSWQDEDIVTRIEAIESTGAEVCDAGEGSVRDYISVLKDRGFKRVLCEGGPGMIGQLVDADAIDQMYLTLDPHLSTGVETPMATFKGEHSHRRMQLENVAADTDGTVFLRYSRTREDVD